MPRNGMLSSWPERRRIGAIVNAWGTIDLGVQRNAVVEEGL
jgi:hypothetical protein